MSRQQIILEAWNRAWGDGDLTAFEKLLSADYTRHSKSGAEDYVSLRKTIETMHTAFPDLTTEILHYVEERDSVAIHWQTKGTHQGEYMDVPPTGRAITVTGASFLQFQDEFLTEESVVWDPRELLSALGIWHLGPGA